MDSSPESPSDGELLKVFEPQGGNGLLCHGFPLGNAAVQAVAVPGTPLGPTQMCLLDLSLLGLLSCVVFRFVRNATTPGVLSENVMLLCFFVSDFTLSSFCAC